MGSRRLERAGLGAVAVGRREDALSGLRLLESRREQQRREGAAGVAEASEQRRHELRRAHTQRAREARVGALVGRVEGDAREVFRRRSGALEQALHGLEHARVIALLEHEALLPGVDEAVALGAPEIDELLGDAVEGLEGRDRIRRPDEEGGRAVAPAALEARARRAHAAVARHDEHAARGAGGDGVRRGAERAEAGAQRAAEVGAAHVAAQVEGLREERRALLLAERVAGGGEEQGVDAGPVEAAQAVHSGRDRHRDGVLVVPGDGLLRAAVLGRAPAERGEGKPRGRHVGAVADDAGSGHSLFSTFTPP